MCVGEGAPKVLFISQDDTGFGQLGCYGRPIEMADRDTLAADDLRAGCLRRNNKMHTTSLCSPSRSCILTVRNHHSNGVACITKALRKEERKCVNMKRSSKYEDMIVEYERSMSRIRFYRRPLHSTGKWILDKFVYVLYLTFRFALDILYYDIFRAWRDS